eukprot:1801706-Heterocapsa_arctica.AAC.1
MAQPASQGGCSAEPEDVDEMLASKLGAEPQTVTLEHTVQAAADMKDITKTLMKAPPWQRIACMVCPRRGVETCLDH